MTIPRQQMHANAHVPLLAGTRCEMMRSLSNNDSYYTIAMQMASLADEASRLPKYILSHFAKRSSKPKVSGDGSDDDDGEMDVGDVGADGIYKTRTEKYLRTSMDGDWRNFVTFLSIPRPMLESIVLGTVAWDYDPARGTDRGLYKQAQHFGVYVIGLSVQGRLGAWLTANETKTMVKSLKTYLGAYDAWSARKTWPLSDRGKTQRDFVAKIDNQFGIHKREGLRFVTSGDGRTAAWSRGWSSVCSLTRLARRP